MNQNSIQPNCLSLKIGYLCIMYFAQTTLRLYITQPGNPQLLFFFFGVLRTNGAHILDV